MSSDDRTPPMMGDALPEGVLLHPIITHRDARGSLAEFHREEWHPTAPPSVQWSVVTSAAGSLRGFHCHWRHWDQVMVLQGSLHLGLRDLRQDQAPLPWMIELRGDRPLRVTIPPGVGHGFAFREPTTYLVGVSHYWDHEDELACHWRDPGLELAWPDLGGDPTLSARDVKAGTLATLVAVINRRLAATE